ncbi:MAG: hypothetical protein LBU16_01475 [Treponema sp.]|nr:hypothetical protein [Treponema sp.]
MAMEFGFVETEAEWIASLKGMNGQNGSSAYRTAVANGFEWKRRGA